MVVSSWWSPTGAAIACERSDRRDLYIVNVVMTTAEGYEDRYWLNNLTTINYLNILSKPTKAHLVSLLPPND